MVLWCKCFPCAVGTGASCVLVQVVAWCSGVLVQVVSWCNGVLVQVVHHSRHDNCQRTKWQGYGAGEVTTMHHSSRLAKLLLTLAQVTSWCTLEGPFAAKVVLDTSLWNSIK